MPLARLFRSPAFPLCVLAAYWAVLIYQLGAQWSVYEQYHYGWAVPVLAVYLLWRRARDEVVAAPAGGVPAPEGGIRVGSLLLLGVCALLYAPTRLLHEANPLWRLTSLLWTVELIVITFLLAGLVRGAQGPTPGSFLSSRALSGPVLFFLLAVPWPTPLELAVTQDLMRMNISATVELLTMLGVPAVARGNVIESAGGLLGIEEACSGIRSLQAALMLAFFFGLLGRLRWPRLLLLAGSAAVIAFLFNVARTLLLSWVAATKGSAAVASWHDPAGVAILLACFVSCWAIAAGLRRHQLGLAQPAVRVPSGAEPGTVQLPAAHSRTATPRRVALALALWFLIVEAGTELWFRAHEAAPVRGANWTLDWPRELASFRPVDLDPRARAVLHCDRGESGRWLTSDGFLWQTFFLEWRPGRSVYERTRVSLAKSHSPEICLQAAGMRLQSELEPAPVATGLGFPLHFRRYIFEAEAQPLYVFFSVMESMESTASPGFLRTSHWDRVKAALAGSRNYGQRTLEIAVTGPADMAQAQAALEDQLRHLLMPLERSARH